MRKKYAQGTIEYISMAELASVYNPKITEDCIYKLWEESGFFNPDNKRKTSRLRLHAAAGKKTVKHKNFTILLPPPNITGSLHMGHALNAAISDVLIRYHRMKGDKTVWLPGTDHAGIAAQNVVEKQLRKEGKTRFNLGREKFIERVEEWKQQSGDMIVSQLKKIGASCDWSRARFTMDPIYARAVVEAFVHYYNKGLLYRALRTISWCPRCQTSISDLEIDHSEEISSLYYIHYGPLVIATVRPETKFGDTAVAVNPHDTRYKKYIGKEIMAASLEVNGSLDKPQKTTVKMLVVGDAAVDPQFGTGVIKVTPAHDMTDYEIAQRHNLPMKQVIDEQGRMNEQAGKYAGMKTAEARKKIVADLRTVGLLAREEPNAHRIALCSRCRTTIEPLPSWQWFLKMGDLAKKAAVVVKTGKTKIIPKNFEKVYFSWLENIRDWCVSRQLWWGQRLPVWFHEKKCVPIPGREREMEQCEEMRVSLTEPICEHCDAHFIQSDDVLDTWFSSALWPFDGLSRIDQNRFYPSSLLITARDIMNLWVGRMIFSGLEFKGKTPFPEAFIHATVLTKDGKRMSKSLGTGIDPVELIEKYGADATRFGIMWQMMGTQDIHWDEAAVVAGKKFANKIWNASRFVIGRTEQYSTLRKTGNLAKSIILKPADKKIIAQLTKTKKEVEKYLEEYQLGHALHALYDFFWHDYCDIYLEAAKKDHGVETNRVLRAVLTDSLKLMHPFMPFITEALYGEMQGDAASKQLLLVAEW